MDSKIKEAIDKSLEELKSIQEKVDNFVDDLPDDTHEVKAVAKKTLAQINSLLNRAVEQAGTQAEEAHLQAHLGVKEAQEKLEASKLVVDDYMARASDSSKRLLDEAQLKQQLAMMEARDFWEKRGSKMAEDFMASSASFQSITGKAVDDLQTAFSQFHAIFNNAGKGSDKDK